MAFSKIMFVSSMSFSLILSDYCSLALNGGIRASYAAIASRMISFGASGIDLSILSLSMSREMYCIAL